MNKEKIDCRHGTVLAANRLPYALKKIFNPTKGGLYVNH